MTTTELQDSPLDSGVSLHCCQSPILWTQLKTPNQTNRFKSSAQHPIARINNQVT